MTIDLAKTAPIDLQPEPTTAQLMQQVIKGGAKAAEMAMVLKELVALKQSDERFAWEREERQARIDFDHALSQCQAKFGLLKPNQGRKSRKTAPEDDIFWLDYVGLDAATRPIYTEAGFAISFSEITEWKDGYVGMTATLSRGGISREFSKRLTTAPAFDGMPKADAEASAASRVKRYLMLQIFNIAVGIDSDEKRGIPPQNAEKMDDVAGWCASMNQAPDLAALKSVFAQCWTKAKELRDFEAKKEFEHVYEVCKRELNK